MCEHKKEVVGLIIFGLGRFLTVFHVGFLQLPDKKVAAMLFGCAVLCCWVFFVQVRWYFRVGLCRSHLIVSISHLHDGLVNTVIKNWQNFWRLRTIGFVLD